MSIPHSSLRAKSMSEVELRFTSIDKGVVGSYLNISPRLIFAMGIYATMFY